MSKSFVGSPPSMGMTASFDEKGLSPYVQTNDLPSGETNGHDAGLLVSLTGSPPSIGTFHMAAACPPPMVA